jgi:hypothetical protein
MVAEGKLEFYNGMATERLEPATSGVTGRLEDVHLQRDMELLGQKHSLADRGAVAICVGIDFGAISSMTRLPDHAARSIV